MASVAECRFKPVGFAKILCFVSCPESQAVIPAVLPDSHTHRGVLDNKAVPWKPSQ